MDIKELKTECPCCGAVLNIPIAWMGRIATCKGCGNRVRIETNGAVVPMLEPPVVAMASVSKMVHEFNTFPAERYEMGREQQGDKAKHKRRSKLAIRSLGKAPLKEWAFTFALFSAVGILFCGKLIYEAVTTDYTGLSAVILIIFALAITKNFLDIKYLDKQVKLADTQTIRLVEMNDLSRFLKESESSLFKDHIHNLFEMGKRDPDVSQDNLITIIQSKVYSRIRLMENAGSILVTAGLIGTIVGLIASVAGLDSVMTSIGKDQTQMLQGFRTTISGMSTAFYTTLVGALLGGIGIRILTNIVESNAEYLVGHIAELSEVYIVPTLRSHSKRMKKKREVEEAADAISA